MFDTQNFYDLSVSEACVVPEQVEKTLRTIYDFGYRTIAIDQRMNDEDLEPKKKNKKGEPRETVEIVPPPHNLNLILKSAEKLNLKNFQVFNRLTIAFKQGVNLHKIIAAPNYKKYDIVAVEPQTIYAFIFASSSIDVDILTLNAENKVFKLKRKLLEKMRQRGYHFEIRYSGAIESRVKRKNIIQLAHSLHMSAKSRNVIISSGAVDAINLRQAYDVINLGLIFGLNQLQCRNAIGKCSKQVVLNSIGRRHGKSVIFVENEEENQQNGKHEQNESVICLEESEREDEENNMDIEPVLKKSKQ